MSAASAFRHAKVARVVRSTTEYAAARVKAVYEDRAQPQVACNDPA
eukprot:CAMPEP_0115874860 /NCGR_PEP_ID=MMETSP0287-20121206/24771_1 /TAXON_ID=412157 /ORGANISM="Chrysochromulina rotalis, Strain UIO044" /LENGTH=45 /DNA_ID= /DNA_START= /DNA_END= /DNA_ORIENTATION=